MRTLFDKATNPNDPIYAPYLMMVSFNSINIKKKYYYDFLLLNYINLLY